MNHSLTLIIDTAHPTARVIIADGEKVLGLREITNTPKVGTDLLVYMEELLTELKIEKKSFTKVAVHTGPGSYGLVRTGITTAAVLADTIGAECVHITGETESELIENAQN